MAREIPQWIRLSKTRNVLLNYTAKARRYISTADLPILEAIEAGRRPISDLVTISARQYEQFRNVTEYGERITKEERTKRLQGKGGRIPTRLKGGEYRTERAKETAQYQPRAKQIRLLIPEIASKDVKLIDKKNEHDFDSLSDEEKDAFGKLFAKYPRQGVLAALGSPPTK